MHSRKRKMRARQRARKHGDLNGESFGAFCTVRTRNEPLAPVSRALNYHSVKQTEGLDELYSMILATALDNPKLEEEEKEEMKLVLDTVTCAQEPITISTISSLLKFDDADQVRSALEPLWSVLHVAEASELVTTLHASFSDYMFEPNRSKSYHCNPNSHHELLAQLCFICIGTTEPGFNICGLESSYIRDEQIPNLEVRVNEAISSQLFYACRYWAVHLHSANRSPELKMRLKEFLSNRLLLWLEIMNLKKSINLVGKLMQIAKEWSTHEDCEPHLGDLAKDSWQFVAVFSLNTVSTSTSHIYTSMLAFWPRSQPIGELYGKRMRGSVEGTAITQLRQSRGALLATWNYRDRVSAMVMSPDGSVIAFGILATPSFPERWKVYLVDALSGRVLLSSRGNHRDDITSLSFSSDGTRILSHGLHGTIRLWDAHTGKSLLESLRIQARAASAAALSPDGSRIVIGLSGGNIEFWDAHFGNLLLSPTNAHSGTVLSIDFSSDGSLVVSAAKLDSIRLWDARNGNMIRTMDAGGTSFPFVRFSPDNNRILCGFSGESLQLCQASSGKLLLKLQGNFISQSAAFSADGTLIACANDNILQLWNTQSGEMVLALEHTRTIGSVVFSLDGARVISSSGWTVYSWDITYLGPAPGAPSKPIPSDRTPIDPFHRDPPIEVQNEEIISLACSPDGAFIASGSHSTIRLWKAQTGEMVLGPLESHRGDLRSIVFSPDNRLIASCSKTHPPGWSLYKQYNQTGPLLAFLPDSTNTLITSINHDEIQIWDAHNGEMIKDSVISTIAIPDAPRESGAPLWDLTSDSLLFDSPTPPKNSPSIVSVAFSPDGSRIASGDSDGDIKLWDTRIEIGQSLKLLHVLRGAGSASKSRAITSIEFSPNGTQIVSASDDCTVRLWDVQEARQIYGAFTGHSKRVTSAVFSSDGTHMISGSLDKTIRIHDIRGSELAFSGSVEWRINPDGWVVDNRSRPLIWVPSQFRSILMHARTKLLISPEGYVRLNFNGAQIGESWAEAYSPV